MILSNIPNGHNWVIDFTLNCLNSPKRLNTSWLRSLHMFHSKVHLFCLGNSHMSSKESGAKGDWELRLERVGAGSQFISNLLPTRPWLKNLAFSLVRDPGLAEDIIQHTWMQAIKHPPKEKENIKPWLAVVARNFCQKNSSQKIETKKA